MPKTQYFTAASLDGFIADSDNSLDWLFQAEATAKAESASGHLYHEFYAQVRGAPAASRILPLTAVPRVVSLSYDNR